MKINTKTTKKWTHKKLVRYLIDLFHSMRWFMFIMKKKRAFCSTAQHYTDLDSENVPIRFIRLISIFARFEYVCVLNWLDKKKDREKKKERWKHTSFCMISQHINSTCPCSLLAHIFINKHHLIPLCERASSNMHIFSSMPFHIPQIENLCNPGSSTFTTMKHMWILCRCHNDS